MSYRGSLICAAPSAFPNNTVVEPKGSAGYRFLMKKLAVIFLIISAFALNAFALTAADYAKRPKLVVVLVIDQFRGDYLTRFEKRFIPAGTAKKPGGFKFLTQNGAWFPFAQYDVLQAMTCTDHATILTGSWPARHGIGLNEWFDPKTKKLVYCTDDAADSISPRRLRTTTVGDELKNVHPESRVFTVSYKDRSAVMLGGHRADLAMWVDEKKFQWETSSYYSPKGALPDYTKAGNAELAKFKPEELDIFKPVGAANGTKLTLKMAATVLRSEKLGRGAGTDILAVSLSNHDILGHAYGPNSKEMEDMTILEDKLISDFLQNIGDAMGGLDNVVIAMTADHGTPPAVEVAKASKLESGRFDFLGIVKRVNARLDEKYGSAGKQEWILGGRLFHYFLNEDVLTSKKLNAADVQAEAKKAFMEETGILDVFTRSDYDKGILPSGFIGEEIRNSYVTGQGGDLVVIAKPFFYEKGSVLVTHMTGWSYDRTVPLIFVGPRFKPGVYAGGKVVDLASTLSFILGVLPPAMAEGKVLSEALR